MINELEVYWNWFLGLQNDGYGFEVRKCVLSVNSHKTQTRSISYNSLGQPLFSGPTPPLLWDTSLFCFSFKSPTHSFSSGSPVFAISLTSTVLVTSRRVTFGDIILTLTPVLNYTFEVSTVQRNISSNANSTWLTIHHFSPCYFSNWSVPWSMVVTGSFFTLDFFFLISFVLT